MTRQIIFLNQKTTVVDTRMQRTILQDNVISIDVMLIRLESVITGLANAPPVTNAFVNRKH